MRVVLSQNSVPSGRRANGAVHRAPAPRRRICSRPAREAIITSATAAAPQQAPPPAAQPQLSVEAHRRVNALKLRLLSAVASLDRGLAATVRTFLCVSRWAGKSMRFCSSSSRNLSGLHQPRCLP
jgi:hypothetical protein